MPREGPCGRGAVRAGRRMAITAPLAGGGFLNDRRAKPATGPERRSDPVTYAGEGGAIGPGLWRTC